MPMVRAIAATVAMAISLRAQNGGTLRFAISFPASRHAAPLDGRVLLFISDLDGTVAAGTRSLELAEESGETTSATATKTAQRETEKEPV